MSTTECIQAEPDIDWSEDELIFRNRYGRLKDCNIEFSLAADVKFRRSVFGVYMKCFNEQQNQDKFLNENKLGITKWDLQTCETSEKISYEAKNDVTDQMLAILEEAVKRCDVINWSFFFKRLKTLRISNCGVSLHVYFIVLFVFQMDKF